MSHAADNAKELKVVLERDLGRVVGWVKENNLKLNVKKTQLLMLSRKSRAQEVESTKVTMDGEQILRSQTVKCLGVWIADNLMWKEHIEAVCKK